MIIGFVLVPATAGAVNVAAPLVLPDNASTPLPFPALLIVNVGLAKVRPAGRPPPEPPPICVCQAMSTGLASKSKIINSLALVNLPYT
jgi:hypothetical protein